MQIELNKENLPILKALTSETRINIIEFLQDEPSNITTIANKLKLSPAIVTRHIQQLEKANIVSTYVNPNSKGQQKFCKLKIDQLQINFPAKIHKPYKRHEIDIRMGDFSNYQVRPTCGLASEYDFIGRKDDPKHFMNPNKHEAQLLWFAEGFVEYNFLNPIDEGAKVHLVEISFEMASEFPENNFIWPSDVSFSLNQVNIGQWTIPGNFADVRGKLNPSWWPSEYSQYGLLKTLRITPNETQIDGEHISHYRLANLDFDSTFFTLRLSVLPNSKNVGGLTLFGEHFGNYQQNIRVIFYYSDN
ncbi:ArsR/SmtB family transcription factor [Fundicoccus sp. Sow4_H7]|uniref:ArsR/SmtB family transcription factor n=1 Tax=Fundicoccus sp. Sow4_H7 TaxID=3438784 RepID=UPI003F8F7B75